MCGCLGLAEAMVGGRFRRASVSATPERIVVTDEMFDLVAEKTALFMERTTVGVAEAKAKQADSGFTLVSEFQTTPFDALHFNVRKGQTFRFELVEAAQILDIVLLNQHNPLDEWASQYHTGTVQGPAPYEDYVFVSSPPYFRPMATIIRDTVDYDRLEQQLGEGGRHMFNFNNYRCTESTVELATGKVNANSCNSNLVKTFFEIGGDEMVATHRHGEAFCIFQATKWELNDGVPLLKFYESFGCFQRGDYIELLAQQDITVVASSCPQGGQTIMEDLTLNPNWPVAVKIFDTGIDLPEIEPLDSEPTIEYMKAGRPGMVESVWGEPGGPGSFEWEAAQTSN